MVGRTSKLISISCVLILVLGSIGIAPGHAEGTSPKVIGKFDKIIGSGELTEADTRQLNGGLLVKSPAFAKRMFLDIPYLEDRIAGWATDVPFTVQGDKAVFGGTDIRVTSFDPGAKRVFSQGSRDSILFSERPMWIFTELTEEGIKIHMEDGDASGQEVWLSRDWLWSQGIPRPVVVHESGQNVTVRTTDDGEHFIMDVPHFSWVQLLVGVDIDIKGRIGTTFVPHTGDVKWNHALKRLEISVPNQLTAYAVWIEKEWVDLAIPYMGLRGYTWTTGEHIGKEYYIISLTSSQSPTMIVLERFYPTDVLTYTRGNPASVSLWAPDLESFEALSPIHISFTTSPHPNINLIMEQQWVVLMNGTWSTGLGVSNPEFSSNGDELISFRLHSQWGFITGPISEVMITNLSHPNDLDGTIQIIPRGSDNYTSIPFHFLPEEYEPLGFLVDSNYTALPRSLVLEEIGVIGAIFDPQDFSPMGIGHDFLPDSLEDPYRIGVWLEFANLSAIHQTLVSNYDSLAGNRSASPAYLWEYGFPQIPIEDSRQLWAVQQEREYSFGNPLGSGPIKSRLSIPLTSLSGAISYCVASGACSNVYDMQIEIYEGEVRNVELEHLLSTLVESLIACMLDGAFCPVDADSIAQFAGEYQIGLANETFAPSAPITVVTKHINGTLWACQICGGEDAIHLLLNVTRAMALDYQNDPMSFEPSLALAVHLGCLDSVTLDVKNFTAPECQSNEGAVTAPTAFPYLDPVRCLHDEAGMVVSIHLINDDLSVDYISWGLPEWSDCLGLGSTMEFGDRLIPDLLTPSGGCLGWVVISRTMGSCADVTSPDIGYIVNMSPLQWTSNIPPCSNVSCELLFRAGLADVSSRIHTATGKTVFAIGVDISWLACTKAELSRVTADRHDRMHERGAALYVTMSPLFCSDENVHGGKPYGALANNSPITQHSAPGQNNYVPPTAIYMMTALAPFFATHEFGHAFGMKYHHPDEDGTCTPGHWGIFVHAQTMKYTGQPNTLAACGGKSIWFRHLHPGFPEEAEAVMLAEIEKFNQVGAFDLHQ